MQVVPIWYSNMFTNPYQICSRTHIKYVHVPISNMFTYPYQICSRTHIKYVHEPISNMFRKKNRQVSHTLADVNHRLKTTALDNSFVYCGATAQLGSRQVCSSHSVIKHTTFDKTPPDERSARCKDL
jgi:hypothetical protein